MTVLHGIVGGVALTIGLVAFCSPLFALGWWCAEHIKRAGHR